MTIGMSAPRQVGYAGQFGSAVWRLPRLAAVTAVPGDESIARELAEAQRTTVKEIAPQLFNVIYGEGGIKLALDRERKASLNKLRSYARAMNKVDDNGRPLVTDELMVAPLYIKPNGEVAYKSIAAPRYSDVESMRRIVAASIEADRVGPLMEALARVATSTGEFLPVPVAVSASTGANVLTVLISEGEPPIAVLLPRSHASSFEGTFGTFGGAVTARDARDGVVLIAGAQAKGALSAMARELLEESGRAPTVEFEDFTMVGQNDLQISFGGIEIVRGQNLRALSKRVEVAADKAEFASISGSRVIGVPLTLDHLTAFMCQPMGEHHVPRLPSWSAALLVEGFARFAAVERAAEVDELSARIATPSSMAEAYAATPRSIRAEVEQLTNDQTLVMAR